MFKAFVYRLYPSKSQRRQLEAVRRDPPSTTTAVASARLRTRRDDLQDRATSQGQGQSHQPLRWTSTATSFRTSWPISTRGVRGFAESRLGRIPATPGSRSGIDSRGSASRSMATASRSTAVASNSPASAGSPSAGTARSQGRSRRPAYSAGLANGSSPSPARSRSPSRCRRPGNRSASTWGSQLATLSNGEKKENPRWYRKILQELRELSAEDRTMHSRWQEPPPTGSQTPTPDGPCGRRPERLPQQARPRIDHAVRSDRARRTPCRRLRSLACPAVSP